MGSEVWGKIGRGSALARNRLAGTIVENCRTYQEDRRKTADNEGRDWPQVPESHVGDDSTYRYSQRRQPTPPTLDFRSICHHIHPLVESHDGQSKASSGVRKTQAVHRRTQR